MRRIKLLLVATFVLPAIVPLLPSPAASQVSSSYTATADARLYAIDFTTAPGVVFEQLVDAGIGVAQSQLDSLGQSNAFASTPYPSESVVLLPGIAAGFTEGQTSGVIPEYPMIASSSHPVTPSAGVEAGSIALNARSDATSSRGDSTDGANQATADVSFDAATHTVIARSETTIGTQRISDDLILHGVRSFAEVRHGGDGAIERGSGFEVAALTVLGQRVAFTPAALDLADQQVPLELGQTTLAALTPLLAALAASGTTVEAFPAVKTDGGVTAGGLIVRHTSVPPPEVASGVEQVVAELRFGGNAVSVENRAHLSATGSGPLGGSAGTTTGSGTAGSSGRCAARRGWGGRRLPCGHTRRGAPTGIDARRAGASRDRHLPRRLLPGAVPRRLRHRRHRRPVPPPCCEVAMNVMRWARTQWDRVSAWLLIALGGLFIVFGWVRVGREALTAQQTPYIISGGIGGLFLLGLGAMLWLSADLRDEWRKLDAIERQRRAELDAHSASSESEPDPFESKVAGNGTTPGTGRRARLAARQ